MDVAVLRKSDGQTGFLAVGNAANGPLAITEAAIDAYCIRLPQIPSSTARYLHTSGNVSVLPISLDLLPAPLGAIWRRDRISRQQVHLFVEVLKDVIKAASASDENTMLAMPDELH
ncbi:hypothetical protein [Glaciimonas sp. PCH181]|uniref:hypothetical protein n=1 Tax=Glaciimonas sp. PCH181 TaxID=2133943 RepID=UPI0011B29EA3|nr:hypothetical protein [Glaciimonas sp. PCH181]